MKWLKRLLFGKIRYHENEDFGILEARVKSEKLSVIVMWTARRVLDGHIRETTLLFDGNVEGPTPESIQQMREIESMMPKILDQIEEILVRETQLTQVVDWRKHFYLEAIAPNLNGFNLIFGPTNPQYSEKLCCYYEDGSIRKVEMIGQQTTDWRGRIVPV